jgi:phosphoglycolate phosphatase
MAIKLILFDLDGTLVDTVADIRNALNYALNPYGTKDLSVEETKKLIGEGLSRLIEKSLGKERIKWKDAAIARFLDHYSKHIADNSTVYPYVRETLERLSDHKKAIISNKKEDLSRDLLKKLDMLKHFELIVGSDTALEKKPSAVPVIYALSNFTIRSDEAVIVGDSTYDIEAGEKAGVKTIAVTYGYGERRHLLNADHIINSFNDLSPVLDIISAELI